MNTVPGDNSSSEYKLLWLVVADEVKRGHAYWYNAAKTIRVIYKIGDTKIRKSVWATWAYKPYWSYCDYSPRPAYSNTSPTEIAKRAKKWLGWVR